MLETSGLGGSQSHYEGGFKASKKVAVTGVVIMSCTSVVTWGGRDSRSCNYFVVGDVIRERAKFAST